jgi:hypothetical protein
MRPRAVPGCGEARAPVGLGRSRPWQRRHALGRCRVTAYDRDLRSSAGPHGKRSCGLPDHERLNGRCQRGRLGVLCGNNDLGSATPDVIARDPAAAGRLDHRRPVARFTADGSDVLTAHFRLGSAAGQRVRVPTNSGQPSCWAVARAALTSQARSRGHGFRTAAQPVAQRQVRATASAARATGRRVTLCGVFRCASGERVNALAGRVGAEQRVDRR